MKLVQLRPAQLLLSTEFTRAGRSKQFEDRLRASIDAIGLVEPIKVARLPGGTSGGKQYLIVDGVLRWRAVSDLRSEQPQRFGRLACYLVDYDQRYELRYQTDIYQDLLPSQLASLVEHLHRSEHVSKSDIARYIGVSGATLRNYTGLWRLVQRGGLFARVVELMDVGILPASNPFAWLRLTEPGLRQVIEFELAAGTSAEEWIDQQQALARTGDVRPLPLKDVEGLTGRLAPEYYREGAEVREMKQRLGLRRAASARPADDRLNMVHNLQRVTRETRDPVLRTAAASLEVYLA